MHADICCCQGKKKCGEVCPLKDTCYRHTCDKGPYESWFLEAPLKEDGTCSHYWPTDPPGKLKVKNKLTN